MAIERERLFDEKSLDLINETLTLGIDGVTEIYSLFDLSTDMIKQLALVGLSHTLGDAPSGVTKAAQLSGANRMELAWDLVGRKWEAIKSGRLSVMREGGPGRDAVALAEVTGIPVADCHAKLKALRSVISEAKAAMDTVVGATPDQRTKAKAAKETLAKIRNNPQFKRVLLRLNQEALDAQAGRIGSNNGEDLANLL